MAPCADYAARVAADSRGILLVRFIRSIIDPWHAPNHGEGTDIKRSPKRFAFSIVGCCALLWNTSGMRCGIVKD